MHYQEFPDIGPYDQTHEFLLAQPSPPDSSTKEAASRVPPTSPTALLGPELCRCIAWREQLGVIKASGS